MAYDGDTDELGRRYFSGLGWSGGNETRSFQEQTPGFSGAGGTAPNPNPPAQPTLANPLNRGPIMPPQTSNPMSRTGLSNIGGGWTLGSGTGNSGTGAFTGDPGYGLTGINGWAVDGNGNRTGQKDPASAGYNQTINSQFGSQPTGANNQPGNPMARQGASLGIPTLGNIGGGSTQVSQPNPNLSEITYNQQQGAKVGSGGQQSPYGSAGFNVGAAVGTMNSGGTLQDHPEYAQYFRRGGNGDDGSGRWETNHPRIGAQGEINIDGKSYGQVGDPSQIRPEKYKSMDPSLFHYDPEFGYVTPADNIIPEQDSWLDKNMIYLAALGLGAPAIGAAMGAGGGATTAAASPDLFGVGAGTGVGTEGAITSAGLGTGGAVTGSLEAGYGGAATLAPELAAGGAGTAGVGAGASGATTATTAGAGSAGSSILNGLGRSAAGSVISRLVGGGNTGGSQGGQTGPTGLNNIGDLLQGGFNLYNDNKGIQNIKDLMYDFYNKGDYNQKYREGYLRDLSGSYTPEGAQKLLAPYADADARAREDRVRKLNAAGFGGDMMQSGTTADGRAMGDYGSGNEMGEITKLQKELDQTHLNDERANLRANASLGNPETMAAAGMRNLPFLAQMQANRNSAANGVIGGALNKLFGNAAGAVGDIIKQMINSGMSSDEVKAEIERQTGGTNTYDENDWENVMRDIMGSDNPTSRGSSWAAPFDGDVDWGDWGL